MLKYNFIREQRVGQITGGIKFMNTCYKAASNKPSFEVGALCVSSSEGNLFFFFSFPPPFLFSWVSSNVFNKNYSHSYSLVCVGLRSRQNEKIPALTGF